MVPAVLHALAWVLMIAAMMLPTTLPLLGDVPPRSPARGVRTPAACSRWSSSGSSPRGSRSASSRTLADAALRWRRGAQSRGSCCHGWMVGATVLAGAGLFQFSALKYRCLEQCHTPFAFVASRWHGRAPSREALRIGVDHGVFCVGCCWALMLLMFVVGTGSLGWMLLLAALMAAEKNLPWGRRLRTPLGVALVIWGGTVIVLNT